MSATITTINDNIIKHLANIVSQLALLYSEANGVNRLSLGDIAQASEGLWLMGFNIDPDVQNTVISRAVGILALNDIVVEFV